jgi:hypothetical protein
MTKEQLVPWIEKLNAAEREGYDGIVAAMCAENGIKKREAWRLLKEAGFLPKAKTPSGDETSKDGAEADNTGADSGVDGISETSGPPPGGGGTPGAEDRAGGTNPAQPPHEKEYQT